MRGFCDPDRIHRLEVKSAYLYSRTRLLFMTNELIEIYTASLYAATLYSDISKITILLSI